ncbi:MAG: DNA repair protein RadA [Bdellovibrionaceae bacterium]|nr:DNA repair protein RadA [Pseudobdellovibrionaceae bacterium]
MKNKNFFSCQNCGKSYSKWVGRCLDCGAWNSLVEERAHNPRKQSSKSKSAVGPEKGTSMPPVPISQITSEVVARVQSGIAELDIVLGGGLVPGSVILVGGEPGIGKSTLLLQAAGRYAHAGYRVLYVTGEESTSQIALRAKRLNIAEENLLVLSATCLEEIFEQLGKVPTDILILDSIQTVYSSELESQPGSVGQLRECSNEIITWAKAANAATFLVGHVTKEGAIAGPKILEHMVDVVLYFDGNTVHSFRLLRSIKNRFGSTNEIGVFEMRGDGMREVTNPSDLFLSERATAIPGSAIVASMEGTRPILVEVQALVSYSTLAIPRRTAIGMDPNRLSLLTAILEKRGGYRLGDQDVYVNIAGGLRLTEPAIDLGILAATISSFSGKSIEAETLFFGEVGLGGEVRMVPRAEDRLKEASRVGFKRAFVPERMVKDLKGDSPLELVAIKTIGQLSDYF